MPKPRREKARPPRRWLRFLAALLALGLLWASAVAAVPILFLRFVPPPATAFMLRSRSEDPATGRACPQVHYRWVAFDEISPHLALAVLVAEDQRFFEHYGFDLKAMERAFRENRGKGRRRGASTLTQQLAKNLFLYPEATYVRKLAEAWFVGWIELLWPKRRILETYLNVAQFGPCRFGVGVAAPDYFARAPSKLGRPEAALLAAVLPSPGRMRAHDPGPHASERAAFIQGLMGKHGGLRKAVAEIR